MPDVEPAEIPAWKLGNRQVSPEVFGTQQRLQILVNQSHCRNPMAIKTLRLHPARQSEPLATTVNSLLFQMRVGKRLLLPRECP